MTWLISAFFTVLTAAVMRKAHEVWHRVTPEAATSYRQEIVVSSQEPSGPASTATIEEVTRAVG